MSSYHPDEAFQLSLLHAQQQDKIRMMEEARAWKKLDYGMARVIEAYWNQVGVVVERFEQKGTVAVLIGEIESDIAVLQTLRIEHELKQTESESVMALELVRDLLSVLFIVLGTLKKRHGTLAQELFARIFSANPAAPRRSEEQEEFLLEKKVGQAVRKGAAMIKRLRMPKQVKPEKDSLEKDVE